MIERHLTSLIKNSLKYFPAVLLIGARQSGKSTLAKQLIKNGLLDSYISLDDINYLTAARTDPDGFLLNYANQKIVLDEIQRVPDLMRALKKSIDENRMPGRFLLTGSANVLAMAEVKESLAGRMDVIHLEGLSMGEMLGRSNPTNLINELLTTRALSEVLQNQSQNELEISKNELYKMIFFGGFPEVWLTQNADFAQRWFAAYQTAYIERDVRDLSKSIDIIPYNKLLKLSALRSGNLLVIKNLATDLGIDQRTVNRYLGLLELTFQSCQLRPWHSNIGKRFVKTSKIYLNDSGFACFLNGTTDIKELETNFFLGSLAETWFYSELRKLANFTPGLDIHFYRTHQGQEVDFILQKGKQLCGVEFKLATNVTPKDFAHLRDLQQAMGDDISGLIFYTGKEIVTFTKNLAAVPITFIA